MKRTTVTLTALSVLTMLGLMTGCSTPAASEKPSSNQPGSNASQGAASNNASAGSAGGSNETGGNSTVANTAGSQASNDAGASNATGGANSTGQGSGSGSGSTSDHSLFASPIVQAMSKVAAGTKIPAMYAPSGTSFEGNARFIGVKEDASNWDYSVNLYSTSSAVPVNDASLDDPSSSTPIGWFGATDYATQQKAMDAFTSSFSVNKTKDMGSVNGVMHLYMTGAAMNAGLQQGVMEWQEGKWTIDVFGAPSTDLTNQAKQVASFLETHMLPPTEGHIFVNANPTQPAATQIGWVYGNTFYECSSSSMMTALQMAVSMHAYGSSTSTSTLQTYEVGNFTADHAIDWPGLPSTPNQYSTVLNVVQIPFNAGYSVQKMTAPQTIRASVPESLQGKLAAYFLQLDNTTAFYLIGPAGMTGKALLAADGSAGYDLHSADATIELDMSGPSPVMAAGLAAPFFASARTEEANDVTSSTPAPLGHATVSHPDAHTAYFSFADKGGQNVAGWSGYLPDTGNGAVTLLYQSDAADWSYAPYVLEAGVNLWHNVLAPAAKGTLMRPQSATVKLGGKSVVVPQSNGRAIQTPQGVAWIAQPPVVIEGSSQSPWSRVATGSYGLAFGNVTNGVIAEDDVNWKQVIPPVRVTDADNDVFHAYPHLATLVDNRWLLYTVTWAEPGMNQPYSNDLHAYDLTTGTDDTITSYNDAGGVFFSLGTSGQYLAYDKSGIVDAQGDFGHHLWLVNLATGKQTKLSTKDLTKSSSTEGGAVQVTVNGKSLTIPLSQW